MSQLPADCLTEIFENLYECNDKVTLHSCLLVNRLWCEVSVEILWRKDWGFGFRDWYNTRDYGILIACLPNESKEFLYENGINIPTKPPMFNYAAFCKVISIDRVGRMVEHLLEKNQQSISNKDIVVQEIFEMFMDQISSLRKLELNYTLNPIDVTFSFYPTCLENLSELICYSNNIYPEILNVLSQICSNIQTICITFGEHISSELIDLIISQDNLKHLTLRESDEYSILITYMIPTLEKLSQNTLIKLELDSMCDRSPSIDGITNLHELEISFSCGSYHNHENNFEELEYATFPQLQILRITGEFPDPEILIFFLESNGENLKELYVDGLYVDGLKDLNLTIAEVCPNLKILTTCISSDDLDALEEIFNNCQHLERLVVIHDEEDLNEYELLEIIIKYSPKNFYELTLDYYLDVNSKLPPQKLESLLISWTNRTPQKPLSLIVKSGRAEDRNSLDNDEENVKIIEKYSKLGAIKKFEVIHH